MKLSECTKCGYKWKPSNGFVEYPKGWEDTGEGGLITHLYVLDFHEYEKKWEECCDDNEFFSSLNFRDSMKGWYQGEDEMSIFKKDDLNRPVLLAMKFASTGMSYWNGFHHFAPGESNLTEDGKEFIASLRKLYGDRRILMQTTLDT